MTISSLNGVAGGPAASVEDDQAALYARQVREARAALGARRAELAAEAALWPLQPPLQVVVDVAVALPDAATAIALCDSLQAQIYSRWRATLVTRGQPPSPEVAAILAHYAAADPRLDGALIPTDARTLHRHLHESPGAWVVLLDRPGHLALDALLRLVRALNGFHEAALFYGDEDYLLAPGVYGRPQVKTAWDPAFGLTRDLFGGLKAMRTDLAVRCGSPVTQGAAWFYDLALRAAELVDLAQVSHLPGVLFHRQGEGDERAGDERAVVAAALRRRGWRAEVVAAPGGLRRVVPWLGELPRVSVIIPTRDKVDYLRRTLEGVLDATDYPDLEVIILDNGSREPATLDYLAQVGARAGVRVLAVDAPFNYADLNNRAVALASGEVLLFLNNDVEVVEGGWLRELVALARRPEAGAVGALLFYPDGGIQHAGVVIGANGAVAEHVALRERAAWVPRTLGATERPVSAVTAACMAIRRAVFDEVGGFDTALAVAYNDVDLCLRLRLFGYTNLWTPAASLIHHESVSRQSDLNQANRERAVREERFMRDRWGVALQEDPWHAPGWSLNPLRTWCDGGVRVAAPWVVS